MSNKNSSLVYLGLYLTILLWTLPAIADDLDEEDLEANDRFYEQLDAYYDRMFFHVENSNERAALKSINQGIEFVKQNDPDEEKFWLVDLLAHKVTRLRNLGEYDSAIETLQYIIRITSTVHGPGHWKSRGFKAKLHDTQLTLALGAAQRKEIHDIWMSYVERDRIDKDESLRIIRRLVSIQREYLGENNLSYALYLNYLAHENELHENYAIAEKLYNRAFVIHQQLLGDHPDTAASSGNLGLFYTERGQYSQAEKLLKKAVAINVKTLGKMSGSYVTSLSNLASFYADVAKFQQAVQTMRNAIHYYSIFGNSHNAEMARLLGNLGAIYAEMGRFDEAGSLAEESYEIYRNKLGDMHESTLHARHNLAIQYWRMGSFDRAASMLRKSLQDHRTKYGMMHSETAKALGDLGNFLWEVNSDHEAAKAHVTKALGIESQIFGETHPSTLHTQKSLAGLYGALGEYAKAEALFLKSLALTKKVFGSAHPKTADAIENLANHYSDLDDFEQAVLLLTEAYLIKKNVYGEKNYRTAETMVSLAVVYGALGEFDREYQFLRESLEIYKARLGEAHPDVIDTQFYLASNYLSENKFSKAESLLNSLLEVDQNTYGKDHPRTLRAVRELALVHMANGQPINALPLFERVVSAQESNLGLMHIDVARSIYSLGLCYRAIGDIAKAHELMRKSLLVNLLHTRNIAAIQSERQQFQSCENAMSGLCAYLGVVSEMEDGLPGAYDLALSIKGSVTARQQMMRSLASQPAMRPLYLELRRVTSQLSRYAYSHDAAESHRRKQALMRLAAKKELLEKQISAESQIVPYGNELNGEVVRGIQDLLPAKSALVDFQIYNRRPRSSERYSSMRLAAFVIRPKQGVEFIDLCSLKDLREIRNKNNSILIKYSDLLWEPLAEHVADAELVLYSPIAELGSVPFAALPGKEPGSYLIEDKQLVMIPQAKLLPSLLEREESPKPTVLAVGGVNYNRVGEDESREPVPLAASRRAVRWQGEEPFDRLSGTEEELAALKGVFGKQFNLGKLQTLKDDRATEAAVKRLAPQYSHLHFATHGFFAPPAVKSALDHSSNRFEQQLGFDDQPRVTGFHPGLLSGLALAGANDPPEEGEDGIWTAEEVATMNLSNVDLAVLSACETGLGKVAGGEGLLGLQRAFQVSGAGTTVASLWQVDDAATRALMTEFYRNLWEKKLPKIEALRQAQLTMLREYDPQAGKLRGVGGKGVPGRKSDSLPPFYWAAWVLSGDWR